jgi:hypothetical protein
MGAQLNETPTGVRGHQSKSVGRTRRVGAGTPNEEAPHVYARTLPPCPHAKRATRVTIPHQSRQSGSIYGTDYTCDHGEPLNDYGLGLDCRSCAPGVEGWDRQPDPNEHFKAVLARLAWLRADAEARELHANEQHARAWSPPDSHGSLADELTLPTPAALWRIKGILGAGHNALLVATRKAGKTHTINHAVKCLADGESFLGRFDTSPVDGGIAVFNYEVGGGQYREWLRPLRIINAAKVHLLHLRGKRLPIIDPRVREWIVKWLRARNVKVWIVDPYSRAAIGSVGDGNAEMQVGAFLDHLDVIKAEAGVEELVMAAHTPKAKVESGDESASGSQRLEGWPDALWYLTKDDQGIRFLRAEGRDVDVAEEQLTYDASTRDLTLGGWDRKTVAKNRDVEMVVAYVADNPGCTQNAIGEARGWGSARTRKAVAAAKVRLEPGPSRSTLHYPV